MYLGTWRHSPELQPCKHTCARTHTHTYTHKHIYTRTHAHTHTHMRMRTHVYNAILGEIDSLWEHIADVWCVILQDINIENQTHLKNRKSNGNKTPLWLNLREKSRAAILSNSRFVVHGMFVWHALEGPSEEAAAAATTTTTITTAGVHHYAIIAALSAAMPFGKKGPLGRGGQGTRASIASGLKQFLAPCFVFLPGEHI